MKQVISLLCFLAVMAVPVFAQVHQIEKAKDHQALAADRISVRDDRGDLDRLSDLILKWDQLRKTAPNSDALKTAEKQIYEYLRKDVKEAQIEVKQAEKEVKKSTVEKNASRVEKIKERLDKDKDKKALKDDKHDLRDDRRDRRDDIRDEKKAEEILAKKRSISLELIELQKKIDVAGPQGDQVLRQKQAALLEEYLKVSQEEIKLGLREIKEDKRELREDRRETREDKKNRK